MREAYNGKEVVELIKEKADINIEIIDGKGAAIIASTDLHHLLKQMKLIFCRCWWGSTEFTLFSNSKIVTSRSFKAGTVRLLNEMVCDVVWDEMKNGLK
jgi:exopolyphosphatase/guanosine-5'-triphosphate,3'-diphosphate pyrophosphatase